MRKQISVAVVMLVLTTGLARAAQQQSLSPVDQHLQILSEKLGLTSEQQTQIRPILSQMIGSFSQIQNDTTLTSEQRQQKIKQVREKAHLQAREVLSEDQRKKLDQMEQEYDSSQHSR